jgi:hypothetical protein
MMGHEPTTDPRLTPRVVSFFRENRDIFAGESEAGRTPRPRAARRFVCADLKVWEYFGPCPDRSEVPTAGTIRRWGGRAAFVA